MDEESIWFKKQIQGLYLMYDDEDDKDIMVAKGDVKKRLQDILNGGIDFPSSIKKRVGLE